jgi:hypothetical protein
MMPVVVIAFWSVSMCAVGEPDLAGLLGRQIIGPERTLAEVQEYCERRVPPVPMVQTAEQWERIAEGMRSDVLERVVFRGEAARWRDAQTKVDWLETIQGGPGYRIKKLRYEALPGLWIPALLYEPEMLVGKLSVALAVNGHDGRGKALPYKQIRCINMAKRGMLVLNPEWLGMGQLSGDGYRHGRMNQLDLCGTSGLAPFYLAMSRGLDVLLAHEHADPERVAVSGLSGGGWQTIIISSLDTRVKLANPVAGYSSFRTRVRHWSDLGDSEQTPCDLATVADYAQLTALMAPRPTLLTYNVKDDCCFASDHALPPLVDAARPIFRLCGKELFLRWHSNHRPGTHNFERENREAFYRMLGDFFFAGDASFSSHEIPSDDEVKTKQQLDVELPPDNANFHTLAAALAKRLPRDRDVPAAVLAGAPEAADWRRDNRAKLRELVRVKNYEVRAEMTDTAEMDGTKVTFWRLVLGNDWTVPAVELARGEPSGTAILIADAGRSSVAVETAQLLADGMRVLAVDPFYFGESKITQKDYLFALLVSTVGDRSLGIQASELAAIARWSASSGKTGPATIVAVGPRTSTVALVAAGIEERAIRGVRLRGSFASLKEVIDKNWSVEQAPEMFCFGLLESFDVPQLMALVAPRPVTVE